MKINTEKLKEIIIQSVSDLRHGAHEDETILIGNLCDEIGEDIQIQLKVTQNTNDFFDTEDPDLNCINY